MAGKKCKGTPLKVFSGKEATLNRITLLILLSEKMLAKYDLFLEIRRIKGFKNIDSKTVYRRLDVLNQEGWIEQKGTRPAKVIGESKLYDLTLKGKAALKLDQKSIEEFLNKSSDEKLAKLIDLL
jgi:DNA-binding PadR family transcriptional regulator